MRLPFLRSRLNKLAYIEVDDQRIDHHLSTVIQELQRRIRQFRSHIDENTLSMKEEALMEIEEQLSPCRRTIRKLRGDIERLRSLEQNQYKTFVVKDDRFLDDKDQQLRVLEEHIQAIMMIITQHPDKESLEHELIAELVSHCDTLQQTILSILLDDHELNIIYRSL